MKNLGRMSADLILMPVIWKIHEKKVFVKSKYFRLYAHECNNSPKEALGYFENHPIIVNIVNIKRKDFDTSFAFREFNSYKV